MDVEDLDGEIEYERLRDAVNDHVAEEYAKDLHACQRTWDGSPRLSHVYAVAKLAEDYANVYYTEADFFKQSYMKLACKLSGLLHESMFAGANFERVVEVSDEAVARIVAEMSEDCRMPQPKRLELYANQIGLARPSTQVVMLANLVNDTTRVADRFRSRVNKEMLDATEVWVWESNVIFRSLGRIKDSIYLAGPFALLRRSLDEIDRKCQSRRR